MNLSPHLTRSEAVYQYDSSNPVQWSIHGETWTDVPANNISWPLNYYYRLKPPEPSFVSWTRADVPPICWLRRTENAHEQLVLEKGSTGLSAGTIGFHTYKELFENSYWKFSTGDNTWLPCRKTA